MEFIRLAIYGSDAIKIRPNTCRIPFHLAGDYGANIGTIFAWLGICEAFACISGWRCMAHDAVPLRCGKHLKTANHRNVGGV